MIPDDRRFMLDPEEHLRYTSFENIDLQALTEKNPIIKIHKNRLEFRIFDGTMVYHEIYYTTMFSILLLGASIALSEKQLDPLLKETDIKILFENLESFIVDTQTINFVINKYNKNKVQDAPKIQISQKQQTVFPMFEITNQVEQYIQSAINTSC